jgi:hypothetical protein
VATGNWELATGDGNGKTKPHIRQPVRNAPFAVRCSPVASSQFPVATPLEYTRRHE